MGDDAGDGDQVRLTPEGFEPIEGVVDHVSPSFLGVRSNDALYRFIYGFDGTGPRAPSLRRRRGCGDGAARLAGVDGAAVRSLRGGRRDVGLADAARRDRRRPANVTAIERAPHDC